MRSSLAIGAGLLAIVGLAYAGVWSAEFVEWDDNYYVYENPVVMRGLTVEGLKSAFKKIDFANYIPITLLSYETDITLFGVNSRWLHVVNVAFHAVNCLLLFAWLRGLTGALWPSAISALLFAVHPLHVESVAWISERKDVLSTFFLLLTLLAYTRYVRNPSKARFVAVCILFGLGLLSKSMLVTLPALLLALDFCLFHRFDGPTSSEERWTAALRLVREKLPLFAMSIACGIVTIMAQSDIGAMDGPGKLALPYRVANALNSYGWYFLKTLLPTDLCTFYPHPLEQVSFVGAAVSFGLLAALSGLIVFSTGWRSVATFGWIWFLVSLLPVIGLLQVGSQARADRYIYMPHLGLIPAFVWMAGGALAKFPARRWIGGLLTAAITIACTVATVAQVAVWHSTESLWRHAIKVDPGNILAHHRLGLILIRSPSTLNESITEFQHILDSGTHLDEGYYGMACAHRIRNDIPNAIDAFEKSIADNPRHQQASIQLADLLSSQKDDQQALSVLQSFAKTNPRKIDVWLHMGMTLIRLDRIDEAARAFTEAVRRDPSNWAAQTNLGLALWRLNRLPQAVEHLKAAAALTPDSPNSHVNLADALAAMGNRELAIEHLRIAIRLNPNDQEARQKLAELK